ncbi:MAG: class I SAM-dependent methyltransferase [Pyrinomonadaceae bacterium]|nr:class I SAM-dependent methyltransferase [Phycisphaerales bacterium]
MPVETPNHIEPHPILTAYYPDSAAKRDWLQTIFDDTAQDYDRVESWLSLGSGRWYRRQALARCGLAPGMNVADVACGTGLVAKEALRIVGPTGRVIGIDPSPGMLNFARENLHIETLPGRAEAIPAENSSFDFISLGYALRHVDDLGSTFAEFLRVLRPGGRLCILEITSPDSRAGRFALAAYMRMIAGIFCRIGGRSRRTKELWRYYWHTINQCARPETVMDALRAAGFTDVRQIVQLGIFSEYSAAKPS